MRTSQPAGAAQPERTVIVPHSARPSIVRSVGSLLETGLIDRVIVITTELSPHLHRLKMHASVTVVRSRSTRFCKATMLNQGLSLVDSGLVLMSDADILWSAIGLGEIIAAVEEDGCDLVWIDKIVESEPTAAVDATSHRRLGFRVIHEAPDEARVELFEDTGSAVARPGYGMLCGMRSSFEHVGGYKTGWGGGWGWEDVDIILRAGLLGLKLGARGAAIHLTHDDALRALAGDSKAESRDRNISLSRRDICDGRLLGALGAPDAVSDLRVLWQVAFHQETERP
jgi:hypothetical protein